MNSKLEVFAWKLPRSSKTALKALLRSFQSSIGYSSMGLGGVLVDLVVPGVFLGNNDLSFCFRGD